MSAPQPSPAGATPDDGPGEPDAPEESEGDDPFDGEEDVEVELADVDVGEPVRDTPSEGETEDDPFDGVEDEDEVGTGGFDNVQQDHDSEWGEDAGFDDGPDLTAISESINAGAARAAVIGLEDEYEVNGELKSKSDLQQEFEEVFEVANLGTFGAQAAEKYLQVDEEVDPLMGFAASLVACAVLVLWMRPDGDEIVGNMTEKVQNLQMPGMPGNDFP